MRVLPGHLLPLGGLGKQAQARGETRVGGRELMSAHCLSPFRASLTDGAHDLGALSIQVLGEAHREDGLPNARV